MARRFAKSSTNRMLFGVAGGIAEYFDIDSMLVRVAFAASVLFTGLGIVAYVLLAIVAPTEPGTPPA